MIKTMVAAIRVGGGDGGLKSGGDGGIDGIRGGGNCGSSGLRCPRSDDGGGNKNGRREAYSEGSWCQGRKNNGDKTS